MALTQHDEMFESGAETRYGYDYARYSRDAYEAQLAARQQNVARLYPPRVRLANENMVNRAGRMAKRYPNAIVVVLLAVALVIAVGCLSAQDMSASSPNAAPSPSLFAPSTPQSTPRSQWKQGTIPSLYQTDAEWVKVLYGDGTMETHGCGPTSLSMIYVGLTGKKDFDPAGMAAFSENNGYIDAGVTSWLLMSEGARKLGLVSREMPADANVITAELVSGRPLICVVGPGDFTDTGHFIVVCGIDSQGKLVVRDPNSAENSAKTWDIDRVLSQCRNIWSYCI